LILMSPREEASWVDGWEASVEAMINLRKVRRPAIEKICLAFKLSKLLENLIKISSAREKAAI
jgi:hypothetical protein